MPHNGWTNKATYDTFIYLRQDLSDGTFDWLMHEVAIDNQDGFEELAYKHIPVWVDEDAVDWDEIYSEFSKQMNDQLRREYVRGK